MKYLFRTYESFYPNATGQGRLRDRDPQGADALSHGGAERRMDLSPFGVRATAGRSAPRTAWCPIYAWTEEGAAAAPATNGAQVLHLSVALCILNDTYREAERLGIRVTAPPSRPTAGSTTSGARLGSNTPSRSTRRRCPTTWHASPPRSTRSRRSHARSARALRSRGDNDPHGRAPSLTENPERKAPPRICDFSPRSARSWKRRMARTESGPFESEPPVGIEPTTYSLRVNRSAD